MPMAADSANEGGQNNWGIQDGICSLPVSCSCFKLLNQSFDEVNQHCSIDILPILLEGASFPARLSCPLHNSHGQDVYSISVLSGEGKSPQCASELAFLSFLEVANLSKNQMCLDAQLNCQNCIDLPVKSADPISPCIVDLNIEKEYSKTPESNDEAVESLKSEGALTFLLNGVKHLQRVLWRQASHKIGGKLMQLFMNVGTSRDKSVTERAHDTPNNRWRRYKRSTSFDSRKIVLLFSIMSSLGTLVLIYLTLKVRQSGDNYVHV